MSDGFRQMAWGRFVASGYESRWWLIVARVGDWMEGPDAFGWWPEAYRILTRSD